LVADRNIWHGLIAISADVKMKAVLDVDHSYVWTNDIYDWLCYACGHQAGDYDQTGEDAVHALLLMLLICSLMIAPTQCQQCKIQL
jgi:hypothetical protein